MGGSFPPSLPLAAPLTAAAVMDQVSSIHTNRLHHIRTSGTASNFCTLLGLSTEELLLYIYIHPFNGLCSRTTWVSRYQKGKTGLDLNATRDDGGWGWQWRQLDHMQTICTSLQTDNHTNTSSVNFYRPDALPDTQPTVSQH